MLAKLVVWHLTLVLTEQVSHIMLIDNLYNANRQRSLASYLVKFHITNLQLTYNAKYFRVN